MIGVSNVPNIWHLAHLRELMIVLLDVELSARRLIVDDNKLPFNNSYYAMEI